MGRFARSVECFKSSMAVLKKDKELLVLPLISGICILLVSATFVIGSGVLKDGVHDGRQVQYGVGTFLFYVVTYTISFFFQAALVAGATERLSGGNPTVGSSLAAAGRRFGPILLWGVIAGTVGMVLRAIQERSGLLGKIVIAIVGIAWSLATFFMVPVLVLEKAPVGESFRRSRELFKKTWGESVAGNVGFALFGFLGFLAVAAVVALLVAMHLPIVAVVVGVLGIAALVLFFSTLQGIYVASLYRYATTGEIAPGFDGESLRAAFIAKRAKR